MKRNPGLLITIVQYKPSQAVAHCKEVHGDDVREILHETFEAVSIVATTYERQLSQRPLPVHQLTDLNLVVARLQGQG